MMFKEKGGIVRLWVWICSGVNGVTVNYSSLKAATLKLAVLTGLFFFLLGEEGQRPILQQW